MDITQATDFPFSLTKSIASLRKLGKSTGTFSKSFLIPATRDNNQLLQNLYSSNQRVIKQMKDKKTALIMVDDMILERGYIKITKIITNKKSRSYEVLFFGDNTEWMTELNNTTLDELPFNQNAQIFSATNIENSWISTYNKAQDQSGNINRFDHIYPWISYGLYRFINGVAVEDIRPAIRYRAIVERGLQKAGFTLTSNLMDGIDWKQLIFPFVGDKFLHTEAIKDDKLFLASRTTPDTILAVTGQKLRFNDDSTGDNFNTSGFWDSTTSTYTVPLTSKYRFRISLDEDVLSDQGGRISILVFKTTQSPQAIFQTDFIEITEINRLFGDPIIIDIGYMFLEAGDIIDFRSDLRPDIGFTQTLIIKATSTIKLLDLNGEIHRGNPFNLSDVLPETNVLSLFADLTKIFNLYWRTDNKTKRVYVEDRDNFFKPITDALNWGQKLDVSREYVLSFLLDYKKEVIFSYIDDQNDAFLIERNKDKLFSQNKYCSYRHVLPDRFQKGITEIKTEEIAATYIIADSLATPSTNPFKPLTSRIWDEANVGGSAPEPSYIYNPRILNFKFDTQTDPDGNSLSWRFEFVDSDIIPSALAVSVFGNPIAHSLSFAQEEGLVDEFYTRTLGIIEDGTQLVAWFNLTASDYLNFDMRDIIYLSSPDELHGYWIVDTIHDFNPLIQPTRVTLLRSHNQDKIAKKVDIDTDWGGDIGDTPTTGDFPDLPARDPVGYGGTKVPTTETETQTEENPERRSIVANNGTRNLAAKDSGSIAFGQGCEAFKKDQNMLGSYPVRDTSQFAIGVGRNDGDRVTGVRSDENGNVSFYNGGVYILDSDGKQVQVTIQSGGKQRPIYLE